MWPIRSRWPSPESTRFRHRHRSSSTGDLRQVSNPDEFDTLGQGIAAGLLGLYVVLAAGTKVLPRRLRFQRWKAWMRAALTLWWMVVITGVWVYHVWYAASP